MLWASGISGDRPIVLLHVASDAALDPVHELLRAQRYWRSQSLGVDVVLLGNGSAGNVEGFHRTLATLAQAQTARLKTEADGAAAGVFVLRRDQIADALRDGLATAARVVLDAGDGGMRRSAARAKRARGRSVSCEPRHRL